VYLRNYHVNVLISTFVLLLATLPFISESAQASTDPVLGAAGDFQIVSGAATSLGASISGLDSSKASSTTSAVNDLRSTIATLSASTSTSVPADLGGGTFGPGNYAAVGGAAFAMTSDVILDGKNNCDSKFVFTTPAAMNTTAGISIRLINGAKASNVYWVAGGAITVAASGYLVGNFLSSAAITIGASSSIDGRFLGMQAVTIGASVSFLGFPLDVCVPAGGLSMSVPVEVETRNLNAGETVTVRMGTVLVTDTRGITPSAAWSVTAACGEFKNDAGKVLDCKNFSYTVSDLTHPESLAVISHVINSMASGLTIVSATSGGPINSVSWTPEIRVSVPFEQDGGTYSGSIVHSFA